LATLEGATGAACGQLRTQLRLGARMRAPEQALHAQATIAGGGVIPHIHKSLINKTQVRTPGLAPTASRPHTRRASAQACVTAGSTADCAAVLASRCMLPAAALSLWPCRARRRRTCPRPPRGPRRSARRAPGGARRAGTCTTNPALYGTPAGGAQPLRSAACARLARTAHPAPVSFSACGPWRRAKRAACLSATAGPIF